ELHLIVDNYSTHKHENVRKWLARNKRITLHFIPTSSSWLNLVERFFGLLTQKQLKRGVFTSVKELEAAIGQFIDQHNKDPESFVWTKSVDQILEKIGRAKAAPTTLALPKVSPSFETSTWMTSPAPKRPPRISWANGFSSCWRIARFSGRAP
ncbi:MAG: hypothetical protein DIZ77_17600, partial [endosymbiont of Seepiophila jonesi]